MSASMTVKEKTKKTSDVIKTCHRPAREPYPRLARQAASIGFDGSTWQREARKMPGKDRQARGENLQRVERYVGHSVCHSGHIQPQISMKYQ